MYQLYCLQFLQLGVCIYDGLEAEVVLFLLDLLERLQECLQLVHPVDDEVGFLLEVHALLHEWLVVLEEVLELLVLGEQFIEAEELVLGDAHEVLKHLCLLVQVFAIQLVEVLQVHVFDA